MHGVSLGGDTLREQLMSVTYRFVEEVDEIGTKIAIIGTIEISQLLGKKVVICCGLLG